MKVIAINGSHRAGKSTAKLLQRTLDGMAERGWETELVELKDRNIELCAGCNSCLMGCPCPLQDDMPALIESLRGADVVIFGSPNYFANVTTRMKCFMDRLRPAHLPQNTLAGKAAGLVCTTGLSDEGIDCALEAMRRFCNALGWVMPGASDVVGTCQEAMGEDGTVRYRRGAHVDPKALAGADHLAVALDELGRKLA